ncbi:MAG: hypothetical protein LBV41_00605 [Cytophagaceae bacterium]|jgi:hypothetical protein|nr:hypothetical protein [Cytophagaceae bacterium]
MAKIVFKALSSNQYILFPTNLLERIPANHPVLIVNQVVDQLNIDRLLYSNKNGLQITGNSSFNCSVLFTGKGINPLVAFIRKSILFEYR